MSDATIHISPEQADAVLDHFDRSWERAFKHGFEICRLIALQDSRALPSEIPTFAEYRASRPELFTNDEAPTADTADASGPPSGP